MRNTIIYAVSLGVILSIFMAIANQIRKGEPRLDQAVVFGLVTGIAMAAYHHWQKKKKANREEARNRKRSAPRLRAAGVGN